MRILVIKLGALGDVVLAFQAFADIRAHHPGARITLLTTGAFAGFLEDAPWFDEVSVDRRPGWWDLRGVLRLRRALRGFDLVYDLQTSGRSSRYFWLAGRPAWSGIAAGASMLHANPGRNGMHTVERQRDQLAVAGVPAGPAAEVGWLVSGVEDGAGGGAWVAGTSPAITDCYALLIPGAAPHRPGKRWPVGHFAALARVLEAGGVTPVVVGAASEGVLAAEILAGCPGAVDLTGRTSLRALAGLAAGAAFAVGNDTGPMHLAAAMGCGGVVLFGADSDPALTAPRGRMRVLRAERLADLAPERVAAALGDVHTLQPLF